jgi:hypothetical protein
VGKWDVALRRAVTVNHCLCRSVRQFVTSGLLIGAAGAALWVPEQARAQLSGVGSVNVQYENNSNLYAFPARTADNSTPTRAESISYGAAFEAAYDFGRQQLYGWGRTAKYDYLGLSELNHTEYTIGAGLKWQLTSILDGNVTASRTHGMVPFLDLQGSRTLSLQTAQAEGGTIGLTLDSNWRIEGAGSTSKSTQSQGTVLSAQNQQVVVPQLANQDLTQNAGSISAKYIGLGPFTTGITFGYQTGDDPNGVVGAATDASYHQSSAAFTAAYKLARTTFDGQVGYTTRTSDGLNGSTSGVTGSVAFSDQLTPKTSFTVSAGRAIQTLYLNLGSEVDTTAGVGVTWQATPRTSAAFNYGFVYRAFPGEAQGGTKNYPVNYEHNANIAVSYQALRWLVVRPYANVLLRSSNVSGAGFNSNAFGVTLTASIGAIKKKQR